MSYAAFELRLCIERLAFQYWVQLQRGSFDEEELLNDIRSFKRLEHKIYELAGNQGVINRHFELVRTFYEELQMPFPFATPHVGKLAKHWAACSEYCHIGWSLLWEDEGVVERALVELSEISVYLDAQIEGLIGWPELPESKDDAKNEIINGFVEGKVTKEELRAFVRQQGLWAAVHYDDGRPSEFAGRAVPPKNG
ncbi:hypothetical protein NNO07_11055 [Pseudomonas resinovorans]|uniref:Uncharacterized protein n=1 Tax=Metapseudomonas resinovorans TaxID=53412 RepID=A0ABT4Y4A8_METRE|nr:hypothetical protein [Pseudomonas resinovorans]MDA8483611.1 hypothetical protein [Pseudomonas resinovorans]